MSVDQNSCFFSQVKLFTNFLIIDPGVMAQQQNKTDKSNGISHCIDKRNEWRKTKFSCATEKYSLTSIGSIEINLVAHS